MFLWGSLAFLPLSLLFTHYWSEVEAQGAGPECETCQGAAELWWSQHVLLGAKGGLGGILEQDFDTRKVLTVILTPQLSLQQMAMGGDMQ